MPTHSRVFGADVAADSSDLNTRAEVDHFCVHPNCSSRRSSSSSTCENASVCASVGQVISQPAWPSQTPQHTRVTGTSGVEKAVGRGSPTHNYTRAHASVHLCVVTHIIATLTSWFVMRSRVLPIIIASHSRQVAAARRQRNERKHSATRQLIALHNHARLPRSSNSIARRSHCDCNGLLCTAWSTSGFHAIMRETRLTCVRRQRQRQRVFTSSVVPCVCVQIAAVRFHVKRVYCVCCI